MTKEQLATKRTSGFSLVEIILAGAVFVFIITGLAISWLYGQESTLLSGQRTRAVFLAEEGIEAARNIRDGAFTDISDGTYGLAIIGNLWTLSGTSDTTGMFTREITVATVDPDRKDISVSVSWIQNQQRTGAITLKTRLTNWQEISGAIPSTNCSNFCEPLGYSEGICRQNQNKCNVNGEVYEPDGNQYCTEGPQTNTCCCQP